MSQSPDTFPTVRVEKVSTSGEVSPLSIEQRRAILDRQSLVLQMMATRVRTLVATLQGQSNDSGLRFSLSEDEVAVLTDLSKTNFAADTVEMDQNHWKKMTEALTEISALTEQHALLDDDLDGTHVAARGDARGRMAYLLNRVFIGDGDRDEGRRNSLEPGSDLAQMLSTLHPQS